MTEQALPKSWSLATLQELAGGDGLVSDGDWVESKDQDPNGSVRLVQLADLGAGHFTYRSSRFMIKQAAERLGCTFLQPGDLLIARMPEPIGRACILPDLNQSAVTVVDVLIWRPGSLSPIADPRWLMHTLNSLPIRKQILSQSAGTTRVRISGGKLKQLEIPTPPLAEQRRIVEKIDKLQAVTARSRASLLQVPDLVARYRTSILRRAFSGELSADIRDRPTASGELPAGWQLRPLGEISDIQGGIQVGKRRRDESDLVEVPYLRVANVQRGWLDVNEVRLMKVTPAEKKRLLLQEGDILMNEGGDRDKLGRGWVWEEQLAQCIHQNHVFRVRLTHDLPPKFVSHFANENGQQYFFDRGTQTTNLASISKSRLASLPVPIPPRDEAIEILRRLEESFAWLKRVERNYVRAIELLDRLDSAVLTKATQGVLVPQDPNEKSIAEGLLQARTMVANTVRPTARPRSRLPTSIEKALLVKTRPLRSILQESGDWLTAQTAFFNCGFKENSSIEDVERFYSELRALDLDGQLEVQPVLDDQGRKVEDRIRLKAVSA